MCQKRHVNAGFFRTGSHNRALKIQEEDGRSALRELHNIGIIYNRLGDYERGLEYVQRALRIGKETADRHGIAVSYGGSATAYLNLGRWEEARACYSKVIELNQVSGNRQGIAWGHAGLAEVAGKTGNYETALESIREALRICEEIEDQARIAYTLIDMADYLEHQPAADPAGAEEALRKALAIVVELKLSADEADCTRKLGALLAREGNWEEAYRLQERSFQVESEVRGVQAHRAAMQSDHQRKGRHCRLCRDRP